MTLKSDPQTSFTEEKLDKKLEPKVIVELRKYQVAEAFLTTEEAAPYIDAMKAKDKARKDIKDLIPLDGHEHRYRVEGNVLVIGSERPGGPVQDRKSSQSLKIEIASEA